MEPVGVQGAKPPEDLQFNATVQREAYHALLHWNRNVDFDIDMGKLKFKTRPAEKGAEEKINPGLHFMGPQTRNGKTEYSKIEKRNNF